MTKLYNRVALAFAGCLVALAGGCSKTAANEHNFRKALNLALSKHPVCLGNYNSKGFPAVQYDDKLLDALGTKGLVTTAVADHNQIRYGLTSAGSATISRRGGDGFFAPMDQAFCYDTRVVDKVLNFTEPSSDGGQTITNVSFTWKLSTPVPSWVTDQAVVRAAHLSPSDIAQSNNADPDSRKQSASLILTHNGWRAVGDTDN